MGVLTTSGSLARVIGPVFVSYIYQEFGTWLLFGIVAASLGFSFIITILTYRVLVPFDQIIKDRPLYDQIKFWKGWTGIWQKNSKSAAGASIAAASIAASDAVEATGSDENDNETEASRNTNNQNVLQQPE